MSENVIGPGDTDAHAAEYVLGTLDFDERSGAQRLRAEDTEFDAKVEVWERRLGELHLMVEPVEPEPEIWQRIRAKLPEAQQPEPVIALPEIKPELEPQPELELTPEPALKPAEPEPKPQSRPEPAIIAAKSVPAASDAPPTAPEAPTLPSWPPPLVQAQVAMPTAAPLIVSTTVKPAADAPAAPAPPVAAVAAPSPPMVERNEKLRVAKRHLALWRIAAVLMTVAVLAVVALLSLWKYLPERVPPVLRPLELMRLVGITIDTSARQRVPAPPESQFNE